MANRIVAVGLLTQGDLDLLGAGFTRAYPVDETPCFSELLRAIDVADRELWSDRESRNELSDSPLAPSPVSAIHILSRA